MSVVERLCSSFASKKTSQRSITFVDSNVVRCAVSKGRSSARALQLPLRRIGALTVSHGLYNTLVFSPTRHNPADDPTRCAEIRTSIPSLLSSEWSDSDIYQLGDFRHFRRSGANWGRLVISLLGPQVLHFSDRSLFRQAASSGLRWDLMDFDSTPWLSRGRPFVVAFSASYLCLFDLFPHCPFVWLGLVCPVVLPVSWAGALLVAAVLASLR